MRRTLAATLALVLSVFTLIPSAMAAEKYYIRTDNGKTVNLREEPSTDSKVLLRIPYGDEF